MNNFEVEEEIKKNSEKRLNFLKIMEEQRKKRIEEEKRIKEEKMKIQFEQIKIKSKKKSEQNTKTKEEERKIKEIKTKKRLEEEELKNLDNSKKRIEFLKNMENEKKIKEEELKLKIIEEEKRRKEEINKRFEEIQRIEKEKEEAKRKKENEEKIKLKEQELKNQEKSKIRIEFQKKMEDDKKKEEELKKKELLEKNNELFNTFKNYTKNEILVQINEQNLKNIFGEKLKEISDLEKLRLFDRKINNCEIKEKLNLNMKLKNPNKECKYQTEIYDNENKLISKKEFKNDTNEIILTENYKFFYNFTKSQSITIILIKHLNNKNLTSKINIPLKKFISNNNNENYEEKIENFTDNELITISLDSLKENEEEKLIEVNFNTNEQFNKKSNLCYCILKDKKILFKSTVCVSSNIKKSDKLKLSDLEPEFEIAFYNDEYEEKKVKILTEELKKGINEKINLPKIDNLNINIFSEEIKYNNFIKLLKKGLNLDLSIAIDFTGSNLDPEFDDSLHYIKNGFINNYEKAMRENIKIISTYNKNDKYNVYGFGAEINGTFQDIFNINRKEDPSIQGIENIISEYKKTVNNVYFSGPTFFSPVFQEIKRKLEINNNNDFNYHILLIISDGEIHDINETIDSIIQVSMLPISIIIIGVGDNVYYDMKRLNGENGKLISSKGEILDKDIIQYVHFNDFADDLNKLTEAVLKYIPEQISYYYKDKI